jgi:hypothetical protein
VPELPLISALMAAYNAERFVGEAIQSALDQDYPADRLEVIVVDDGSTDGTADVVRRLAERHPGRVRFVQQANAGLVPATNRALAEARGELLALLDADDVWPRDKTRRQQALLAARAEVGLVYGDMCVIDAGGRVLQESWLVGEDPPEGRFSAAMLLGNDATASSIMMRASLGPGVFPIPPGVPFQDWWFMVRGSQVSEVAYLAEPRTLYRYHGANLSLGARGADRLRELRKSLVFQRRFLRGLGADAGSPADLLAAWRAFERNAGEVLELAGSPFAPLVDVTPFDREEARTQVAAGAELLARGSAAAAMPVLVGAAAADPACEAAREAMIGAAAAADEHLPGQRPLAGAAPFVVRADASELLADPALLTAYGREMAGVGAVTLAIDASALDPATAADVVGALVSDVGLADDDDLDLLAVVGPLDVVGRARLAAGTHARYGAAADADGPPAFTPATLGALRGLAA